MQRLLFSFQKEPENVLFVRAAINVEHSFGNRPTQLAYGDIQLLGRELGRRAPLRGHPLARETLRLGQCRSQGELRLQRLEVQGDREQPHIQPHLQQFTRQPHQKRSAELCDGGQTALLLSLFQ